MSTLPSDSRHFLEGREESAATRVNGTEPLYATTSDSPQEAASQLTALGKWGSLSNDRDRLRGKRAQHNDRQKTFSRDASQKFPFDYKMYVSSVCDMPEKTTVSRSLLLRGLTKCTKVFVHNDNDRRLPEDPTESENKASFENLAGKSFKEKDKYETVDFNDLVRKELNKDTPVRDTRAKHVQRKVETKDAMPINVQQDINAHKDKSEDKFRNMISQLNAAFSSVSLAESVFKGLLQKNTASHEQSVKNQFRLLKLNEGETQHIMVSPTITSSDALVRNGGVASHEACTKHEVLSEKRIICSKTETADKNLSGDQDHCQQPLRPILAHLNNSESDPQHIIRFKSTTDLNISFDQVSSTEFESEEVAHQVCGHSPDSNKDSFVGLSDSQEKELSTNKLKKRIEMVSTVVPSLKSILDDFVKRTFKIEERLEEIQPKNWDCTFRREKAGDKIVSVRRTLDISEEAASTHQLQGIKDTGASKHKIANSRSSKLSGHDSDRKVDTRVCNRGCGHGTCCLHPHTPAEENKACAPVEVTSDPVDIGEDRWHSASVKNENNYCNSYTDHEDKRSPVMDKEMAAEATLGKYHKYQTRDTELNYSEPTSVGSMDKIESAFYMYSHNAKYDNSFSGCNTTKPRENWGELSEDVTDKLNAELEHDIDKVEYYHMTLTTRIQSMKELLQDSRNKVQNILQIKTKDGIQEMAGNEGTPEAYQGNDLVDRDILDIVDDLEDLFKNIVDATFDIEDCLKLIELCAESDAISNNGVDVNVCEKSNKIAGSDVKTKSCIAHASCSQTNHGGDVNLVSQIWHTSADKESTPQNHLEACDLTQFVNEDQANDTQDFLQSKSCFCRESSQCRQDDRHLLSTMLHLGGPPSSGNNTVITDIRQPEGTKAPLMACLCQRQGTKAEEQCMMSPKPRRLNRENHKNTQQTSSHVSEQLQDQLLSSCIRTSMTLEDIQQNNLSQHRLQRDTPEQCSNDECYLGAVRKSKVSVIQPGTNPECPRHQTDPSLPGKGTHNKVTGALTLTEGYTDDLKTQNSKHVNCSETDKKPQNGKMDAFLQNKRCSYSHNANKLLKPSDHEEDNAPPGDNLQWQSGTSPEKYVRRHLKKYEKIISLQKLQSVESPQPVNDITPSLPAVSGRKLSPDSHLEFTSQMSDHSVQWDMNPIQGNARQTDAHNDETCPGIAALCKDDPSSRIPGRNNPLVKQHNTKPGVQFQSQRVGSFKAMNVTTICINGTHTSNLEDCNNQRRDPTRINYAGHTCVYRDLEKRNKTSIPAQNNCIDGNGLRPFAFARPFHAPGHSQGQRKRYPEHRCTTLYPARLIGGTLPTDGDDRQTPPEQGTQKTNSNGQKAESANSPGNAQNSGHHASGSGTQSSATNTPSVDPSHTEILGNLSSESVSPGQAQGRRGQSDLLKDLAPNSLNLPPDLLSPPTSVYNSRDSSKKSPRTLVTEFPFRPRNFCPLPATEHSGVITTHDLDRIFHREETESERALRESFDLFHQGLFMADWGAEVPAEPRPDLDIPHWMLDVGLKIIKAEQKAIDGKAQQQSIPEEKTKTSASADKAELRTSEGVIEMCATGEVTPLGVSESVFAISATGHMTEIRASPLKKKGRTVRVPISFPKLAAADSSVSVRKTGAKRPLESARGASHNDSSDVSTESETQVTHAEIMKGIIYSEGIRMADHQHVALNEAIMDNYTSVEDFKALAHANSMPVELVKLWFERREARKRRRRKRKKLGFQVPESPPNRDPFVDGTVLLSDDDLPEFSWGPARDPSTGGAGQAAGGPAASTGISGNVPGASGAAAVSSSGARAGASAGATPGTSGSPKTSPPRRGARRAGPGNTSGDNDDDLNVREKERKLLTRIQESNPNPTADETYAIAITLNMPASTVQEWFKRNAASSSQPSSARAARPQDLAVRAQTSTMIADMCRKVQQEEEAKLRRRQALQDSEDRQLAHAIKLSLQEDQDKRQVKPISQQKWYRRPETPEAMDLSLPLRESSPERLTGLYDAAELDRRHTENASLRRRRQELVEQQQLDYAIKLSLEEAQPKESGTTASAAQSMVQQQLQLPIALNLLPGPGASPPDASSIAQLEAEQASLRKMRRMLEQSKMKMAMELSLLQALPGQHSSTLSPPQSMDQDVPEQETGSSPLARQSGNQPLQRRGKMEELKRKWRVQNSSALNLHPSQQPRPSSSSAQATDGGEQQPRPAETITSSFVEATNGGSQGPHTTETITSSSAQATDGGKQQPRPAETITSSFVEATDGGSQHSRPPETMTSSLIEATAQDPPWQASFSGHIAGPSDAKSAASLLEENEILRQEVQKRRKMLEQFGLKYAMQMSLEEAEKGQQTGSSTAGVQGCTGQAGSSELEQLLASSLKRGLAQFEQDQRTESIAPASQVDQESPGQADSSPKGMTEEAREKLALALRRSLERIQQDEQKGKRTTPSTRMQDLPGEASSSSLASDSAKTAGPHEMKYPLLRRMMQEEEDTPTEFKLELQQAEQAQQHIQSQANTSSQPMEEGLPREATSSVQTVGPTVLVQFEGDNDLVQQETEKAQLSYEEEQLALALQLSLQQDESQTTLSSEPMHKDLPAKASSSTWASTDTVQAAQLEKNDDQQEVQRVQLSYKEEQLALAIQLSIQQEQPQTTPSSEPMDEYPHGEASSSASASTDAVQAAEQEKSNKQREVQKTQPSHEEDQLALAMQLSLQEEESQAGTSAPEPMQQGDHDKTSCSSLSAASSDHASPVAQREGDHDLLEQPGQEGEGDAYEAQPQVDLLALAIQLSLIQPQPDDQDEEDQ